MTIVIPMAGRSSRFFDAGYTLPKYQLKLGDQTVFERSVLSFAKYFHSDNFIFVVPSTYDAAKFVASKALSLDITQYEIIELDQETRGQAETVYLGIENSQRYQDSELYIFNIDTFRPNFTKPELAGSCDGYLEVFRGEGDHWSFVEPGHKNTVLRTTEKERISNYCSDGLYFFKNASTFTALFEEINALGELTKGEFYIAPMYNRMIALGMEVKYDLIGPENIEFCGIPREFVALGGEPAPTEK